MSARLRDLHHIPHELERFLCEMDAILRIAVLKHTGQAGNGTADGHISVAAPDDVFRLLPEPSFLRTAVSLVPDGGAPPDPACPLQGIGGSGELTPVDEHTHRRTRLADFTGLVKPFGCPACPAALILGVSVKGRRRFFSHAGILFRSGAVLLRLCSAAGGIGRIGDHCVKGVGGKGWDDLQGIALDDFVFGFFDIGFLHFIFS